MVPDGRTADPGEPRGGGSPWLPVVSVRYMSLLGLSSNAVNLRRE